MIFKPARLLHVALSAKPAPSRPAPCSVRPCPRGAFARQGARPLPGSSLPGFPAQFLPARLPFTRSVKGRAPRFPPCQDGLCQGFMLKFLKLRSEVTGFSTDSVARPIDPKHCGPGVPGEVGLVCVGDIRTVVARVTHPVPVGSAGAQPSCVHVAPVPNTVDEYAPRWIIDAVQDAIVANSDSPAVCFA